MKTALIATVLAGLCATSAFAAIGDTKQEQNIEQKKAEIIQHIEQRIANSQQEKVCVQAAQSHSEIIACREKYRPQGGGGQGGQSGRQEKNQNRDSSR